MRKLLLTCVVVTNLVGSSKAGELPGTVTTNPFAVAAKPVATDVGLPGRTSSLSHANQPAREPRKLPADPMLALRKVVHVTSSKEAYPAFSRENKTSDSSSRNDANSASRRFDPAVSQAAWVSDASSPTTTGSKEPPRFIAEEAVPLSSNSSSNPLRALEPMPRSAEKDGLNPLR